MFALGLGVDAREALAGAWVLDIGAAVPGDPAHVELVVENPGAAPDTWDMWLKGEPDAAAAMMKAASEDVLVSRLVSKAVGNVKNNGPELLG